MAKQTKTSAAVEPALEPAVVTAPKADAPVVDEEASLLAGRSEQFKADVAFQRVRHAKTLSAAIAAVENQTIATA